MLENVINVNEPAEKIFYYLLYPPAEKSYDEILEYISTYDKENIRIVEWKDFYLSKEEFIEFTNCIYNYDGILEAYLIEKQKEIWSLSGAERDEKRFRIIKINVLNPNFYFDSQRNRIVSLAVIDLKWSIRREYKKKYFRQIFKRKSNIHDVTIHSTDNTSSSLFFEKQIEQLTGVM